MTARPATPTPTGYTHTCHTHLMSGQLVEFLRRVQHQPLLLRALLALGHQSGELIAFKQTGDLWEDGEGEETDPQRT